MKLYDFINTKTNNYLLNLIFSKLYFLTDNFDNEFKIKDSENKVVFEFLEKVDKKNDKKYVVANILYKNVKYNSDFIRVYDIKAVKSTAIDVLIDILESIFAIVENKEFERFKTKVDNKFDLEKVILKKDNKFFEKLQEKGFYITDSGDTKIVFEHCKNKCQMFLSVADNGLYLNFKNSIGEYFNQGWCLGNINDLFILEDIFEILETKSYLEFANKICDIRIHEGSKNWKMNIKNIILSKDNKFIDKIQELGFSFITENLDRLEFLNYRTNTTLTLRQYETCIFYNFRNEIGKYFYDNGFATFLCFTDDLKFDELFKVINTRDFEIFMEQDINKLEPLLCENDTQKKIKEICDEIAKLLIDKNKKYGNSALKPKNIFYKGNAENSILIRLDDKIGRIINNNGEIRTNDIVDIIGYLILLLISKNVMTETIAELRD